MDRIDFRSDTVTWPTETMREVMARATVGDDVYGEDPTVNELEARSAQKVGMEAGLFVASGTMGNLVAALSHAGRGDEAIVGHDSHSVSWEAGSISALGGIVVRPLPTDAQGRMALEEIEAAVNPDNVHLPPSRLILVENSYGARNGYPIAPHYFAGVRQVADRHGLSVHLDGARLFNAAVALGVEASAITQHVDSVTFCLSKGLCAPVGSVVCGSNAFISRARRMRKALGGGMRQAGILAAAGLVALEEMVDRLADDHRLAKRLAHGLAQIPGIAVDTDMVRTNIVFFKLEDDAPYDADDIIEHLRREANIWVGGEGRRYLRAVTHYWLDDDDVDCFLETLRAGLA
ncbi:MAG: GntG family PLP-dependent aldolase [bacterium]